MVVHYKGQIVQIKQRKALVRYLLQEYLGEYRSTNRTNVFKLIKPTSDGKDAVRYEVWQAIDLDVGISSSIRVPVYVYLDDYNQKEQYIDTDRLVVDVDDSNEVTSLMDHYECWFTGNRDNKNFLVDLQNEKHQEELDRLRKLDNMSYLPKDLRTGIRLKLIQKETPDVFSLRALKDWKLRFPDLFIKITDYVYKNKFESDFNVPYRS